jgi:hypothetical protein
MERHSVSLLISAEFLGPKLLVAFRQGSLAASRVLMPKAAVYKYSNAKLRKDNIGATR